MVIKQDNYNDNWASQFAKLFKEREQQDFIGNVIGDVVETEPLVITILDGNVVINSEVHQVYLADNLTKNVNSVCCDKIKKGDSVLVLTDVDEEVFYVVSRLVRVGV